MYYKLFTVLFTQVIMGILLFLMLFPQEGVLFDFLWIFCSILFLLYLPWYWIWYIFFDNRSLNALERFIMSFLISWTLTILISYYLYYIWIDFSSIKIYLITFVVILTSVIAVLIRWRKYTENDLEEELLDTAI